MGFWSELGDIAGKALVAFAEIKMIIDWEEIKDFDEMEDAVRRFVRYASREQIKMAKRGFSERLLNQQDARSISRVLTIHEVFSVELFRRFGED